MLALRIKKKLHKCATLKQYLVSKLLENNLFIGLKQSVNAPTCESPGQAGVVLDGLPGDVDVNQSLSDGLAVVDHFQLRNILPSLLFLFA